MTALLEYPDLIRDAGKAKLLQAKTNDCKFLVRKCVDKQLACKLFLFTTAGANSTLISSWRVQIGFVHKRLWGY